MNYRRVSAAVLSAVLAIGTLSGCGAQKQKETTEKVFENTQQTTEKVKDTESTETLAEETAKYPEIQTDDKIKDYQSVVTVGDTAFELYTYLDKTADDYAKSINTVADNLKGKADVYDLVIPLSSEIIFPDNLRNQITSSDQHEAMQKIQEKMDENVKNVDIYDVLMQHRNEYVYYRTDHHWTTLGAYYAYQKFCEAKGIEPEKIEDYETKEFDGFLGSFYNDTGDDKLKKNPDTVTAYYPKADSICHVNASDGTKYDWPVIYDVSNYGAGLKYSAFIASDNPFTEIENKELSDNSACVVVKESFGNAFIPFLVDHYQKIYVVDYRYWTGSISKLAEEKKVQDVLFLNNLSMIRNKSLVGKLHRVL